MALMTVCPACNTRFKVVQDQLRLHHGLVRCGSCSHVFDANQRLESLPEIIVAEPNVSEEIKPEDWINKPAVVALTNSATASSTIKNDVWSELLPTAAHIGSDVHSHGSDAVNESIAATTAGSPPSKIASSQPKLVADDRRQATLDFQADDAQHRHHSGSSRPAKVLRFVLTTLCILALLGVMAQLMVQGRFLIASKLPELKPVLNLLCQPVACTVEPAHWLAPLTLDALSLSKLNTNSSAEMQPYRVQATVRNSSQLRIKTPDIELTVSNAQGNIIARKTLTPQQLGGTKTLAVNSDWLIDSVLLMDQQTVGYTARLVYLP